MKGRISRRLALSNEHMGCIRRGLKVKDMKACCSWGEFNDALGGMNLEVATTIKTVIGDVMFLAHMIESKDIGNAVRIKLNFVVTKISNSCSGH